MTTQQTAVPNQVFEVNGELAAGIKATIQEERLLAHLPVKKIVGRVYNYEEEKALGDAKFRELYEVYSGKGQESVFKQEYVKAIIQEVVVDDLEQAGVDGYDLLNSRISGAGKNIRKTLSASVLNGTGTKGEINGLMNRVLSEQKVTASDNIIDDIEALLSVVEGDNILIITNQKTARKLTRAAGKDGNLTTSRDEAGKTLFQYGGWEIIQVLNSDLEDDKIFAIHVSEEDGVCLIEPHAFTDGLKVDKLPTDFAGEGVRIQKFAGLACFNPTAIAVVQPEAAE